MFTREGIVCNIIMYNANQLKHIGGLQTKKNKTC